MSTYAPSQRSYQENNNLGHNLAIRSIGGLLSQDDSKESSAQNLGNYLQKQQNTTSSQAVQYQNANDRGSNLGFIFSDKNMSILTKQGYRQSISAQDVENQVQSERCKNTPQAIVERTLQLIQVMIQAQKQMEQPLKETLLTLSDKALRELYELTKSPPITNDLKIKAKQLKQKNKELEVDLQTLIQITNDHQSDLLYWRSQTHKKQERIKELEQGLMKNYASQAEVNKTLDKLMVVPLAQICY